MRRLLLLFLPAAALAAPPRYDHVVIVVEENHALGQIIGDTVNAPYITQLANGGVSFANMFALTHPSQPNYLHLFSGSAQGVTTDGLVVGYPLSTPNLGASLLAGGFTFRGFSEGLRAVGDADWDPRTATHPGVKYRRKHNPWANWQGAGVNQLPAITNDIFANFPTDFAQLPTVSFVIPDQAHDMHDGTRRMGDDWLVQNLSAYAQWAPAHNSLLVITWDEDDYNLINRIPTVLYGANLKNGTSSASIWTLHNLLRTVEDMYGLAHSGRAELVAPIAGVFAGEETPLVATLRQGLNGYAGCRDTLVAILQPSTNLAAAPGLTVSGDTAAATGAQPAQALVRFDALFGDSAGQVPPISIILSTKLVITTGSGPTDITDQPIAIHRMIAEWSDSSTWHSLVDGVATDGSDARGTPTFTHTPNVVGVPAIFDVTADVEAWRTGDDNHGWVLIADSSGPNGWVFRAAETTGDVSARPTLEITYIVPTTPFQVWATEHSLTGAQSSPSADSERDGSGNMVEFAFNMNPTRNDPPLEAGSGAAGLPIVRSVGVGNARHLELEFIRRKAAAASGLTYEAQFGSDLADFTTVTTPDTVTSVDLTWERVVLTDPVPGAARRFARVKLTLAP